MQIEVKEDCGACRQCLSNCPNNMPHPKGIACLHCKPDSAACSEACARGAIVEIAEGILSIDEKICNACGECATACPVQAIFIHNGKAVKCDLCAKNEFFMACLRECHKSNLQLKKTMQETSEIENSIGWMLERPREEEIKKNIKRNERTEIYESSKGEICYAICNLPELSVQEARLGKKIISQIREENYKKEQIPDINYEIEKFCSENLIELEDSQKQYLAGIISLEILQFGAISELLRDEMLEEIAIIGSGREKPVQVYHKTFGWMKTNIHYANDDSIRVLANRMASHIGRRLSMQTPKINAVLPDGNRLTATIPPVSYSGASITIRKFNEHIFSPAELIKLGTISAECAAILWLAIEIGCSIMICGNTGCGKTSTLNALMCFVPENERIIITEETPELRPLHQHTIKMNVSDSASIGMQELIIETLRMRPDRVVVGEIRNKSEVAALIDTILAGQGKGSFATFHAQSSEEAISRLRNLGVLEIDLSAIDALVVQRRWDDINTRTQKTRELRHIVEITELSKKSGKICSKKIFEFNYAKRKIEKTADAKRIAKKAAICLNCGPEAINSEIEKRAKFLEKAARNPEYYDAKSFFGKIRNWRDEIEDN